ncbi:MAG TPA: beta-ketoacyl synthase N-terminal-like domain-containing protein, partial [Phototrophicaceae bacterium]|nr:beta-ketoacyl synthase N-terminal-like domain-containing protein [Phototrophicaceae bacterium]
MRQVAIVGTGTTPVGEHWDTSLRMLAADAIRAAMANANISSVDALYAGNAYGSSFSSQSQVGALIADYSGLTGIEALTLDAADASGAAALRAGYLAVASGAIDVALVVGVEKSTDSIGSTRVQARGVSLDADYEAIQGATLTGLCAMLMRRYMYEYGVELSAFEGFTINAHRNGSLNENAMFRNIVKAGAFARASMVADPVNLFDGAPDADGAAAVILTTAERAADLTDKPVFITGSAVATDSFALQDREDLLYLKAADYSAYKAYQQAGITTSDVDLFELHDAFTILSVLSLEATGHAHRGEGWKLAQNAGENLGLKGSLPVSTFGGLKSRGNPVGATGVYQAVEAYLQ